MWFDLISKDLDSHLMKRKSSAGLMGHNTMINHQSSMDLCSHKLQTSGTMPGRNLSIIL
jgi:hypothetical protein